MRFKSRFHIRIYLFRAVKITKNADLDKYGYSGYVIGYEVHSQFLLTYGSWGKNVVVFSW